MPKSTLFSFTSIPRKPKELCEMPEFEMKCPFVRAALTILALCQYSFSPDDSIEMLELLAGPGSFSLSDLSLLRKKLHGREYIPFSFFANATPENAYDPSLPLTISVKDTAFSYKKDGYATLYVQSSGAETPRWIQLRKKESTGEWFLWDHRLLDPISEPRQSDPFN